jgi:VIT1/CCC1 family predicted Fe2+/Mn2+ transporter
VTGVAGADLAGRSILITGLAGLLAGRSARVSGARQVLFGLAAAAITFGLGKLISSGLSG